MKKIISVDVKTGKFKKEKVGYTMIHRWVRGRNGRPAKCYHCGKRNNPTGRSSIEWASVSREYKRDLSDWIPLCRSCHMKFDNIDRKTIQTNLWKNKKYRNMMVEAHKHCKCKYHQYEKRNKTI